MPRSSNPFSAPLNNLSSQAKHKETRGKQPRTLTHSEVDALIVQHDAITAQAVELRRHQLSSRINTHTTYVVDAAATRVIDTLMPAITGAKRTCAGSATPIASGTPTATLASDVSGSDHEKAPEPAAREEVTAADSVGIEVEVAAAPVAAAVAEVESPEVAAERAKNDAVIAEKDATIAKLTLEADLLRGNLEHAELDAMIAEKDAALAKLQAESDRLTIARLTAKCVKEECARA